MNNVQTFIAAHEECDSYTYEIRCGGRTFLAVWDEKGPFGVWCVSEVGDPRGGYCPDFTHISDAVEWVEWVVATGYQEYRAVPCSC